METLRGGRGAAVAAIVALTLGLANGCRPAGTGAGPDATLGPLTRLPTGYALRELTRLPGPAAQMAMAPRGGALYTLGRSGDLWRIDPTDGRLSTILRAEAYAGPDPGGRAASGLAFDRQGRLYLALNLPGRSATTAVIYRSVAPVGDGPIALKSWFVLPFPAIDPPFHRGIGRLALGPDGQLYSNSWVRSDLQAPDLRQAAFAETLDATAACLWSVDPAADLPTPRIIARGLCDASGFCWNPRGDLYALDDYPEAPAELNHIERGRHYGFPYTFANYLAKPNPKMPDPAAGLKFTRPIANVGPAGGFRHGSFWTFEPGAYPSALAYLGDGFPAEDQGSFLVARSGNRIKLPTDRGFDLLQVRLRRNALGLEEAEVHPFLAPLARPVDLLTAAAGTLYVCEDATQAGYKAGLAAAAAGPGSGRILELSTTFPGDTEGSRSPASTPQARRKEPHDGRDGLVGLGLAYLVVAVCGLNAFAAGGGALAFVVRSRGSRRLPALTRFLAVSTLLASVIGVVWLHPELLKEDRRRALLTASDDLVNCRFTPALRQHRAPAVIVIPIPQAPDAGRIDGALGRDSRGHLWFAVSTDTDTHAGDEPRSAYLFEYQPSSGRITPRGDALSELKRLGIARGGESPCSVPGRIVQAEDGALYFATVGSGSSRERRSHLWRVHPDDGRWEHLMETPETLAAVAGSGRFVYTLTDESRTLSQFTCATDTIRSVSVGSARGERHSPSLVADVRGHVFTTRLAAPKDGSGTPVDYLVEYDAGLKEVMMSPRPLHDFAPPAWRGIAGSQHLPDGSIVFVTELGFNYRLTPRQDSGTDWQEIGYFYPKAQAVRACPFAYDGVRFLGGLSKPAVENRPGGPGWEWVIFDLTTHKSEVFPLDGLSVRAGPFAAEAPRGTPLATAGSLGAITGLDLIGSETRDDFGNDYLGGHYREGSRQRPLLVCFQTENVDEPDPVVETVATPTPEPSPDPTSSVPLTVLTPLATSSKPDDDRARFLKALRTILDAQGDAAAPAIEALCRRESGASSARPGPDLAASPTDRTAHIRTARSAGVPEPAILEDLVRQELKTAATRRDATLRAARALVSVPWPEPAEAGR